MKSRVYIAASLIIIALLANQITIAQTFIGIDTLNIKSSRSRSAIVPQADTNVTLRLPRSSGTIALESNGVTSAASTGTAIAYVADTTITGGDWVTVAELQVDSGKGGVFEFYFLAQALNPARLVFYEYCEAPGYQLTSYGMRLVWENSPLNCGGPLPNFPVCMQGAFNINKVGWLTAPFQYHIETTFSGSFLCEGEDAIYRRGILAFKFQPVAQLATNLDLQNNYQIATTHPNPRFASDASDIWHQKYLVKPTSSGKIKLKFRNFRGQVAMGIGTAANCCGNIMVNVLSDLRIQRLRMILH